MKAGLYNQLLDDIQGYLKSQYQLLQVRSVEQVSQLIGLIIALFAITAIVVIGLIFFAIALAAWLELWLPMWASYLVIAGVMLLIALAVYWGRNLWFVRPIEKHLGAMVLGNPVSLSQQKQVVENQATMQHELLERDVAEMQRDWAQVQRIWQMIRGLFAGGSD